MRTAVLAAVMMLLVAPACGDPEAESPPTPAATSTQTTEQFALVREVAGGYITFDPAEFLSGEEALRAARADGAIGPDDDLPNDFYIRNPSTEVERLPAHESFQARLLNAETLQPSDPIEYPDLERLFSGEASADAYYGVVPGELPMRLTLEGGTVIAGVQQYLP